MSDSPRPVVSAVVVSYNTREMTLDCLRSLYADLGDLPAEVFVVDNASSDGSAAAVRAAFPDAIVIENAENRGFGGANNQAMALARGESLLLLNSDAFVEPGAIRELVATLEGDLDAAAVGPRLLNGDGSLQLSCFRFPSPARAWIENLWLPALLPRHPVFGDYRRWAHDADREVDWVIGACVLVRRAAYEQVGGFDERFHMYAEETDWQKRMRDRGWRVLFTPRAVVTHLGGASGAAEKARVNRSFFESLDHYERKHHGAAGLVSLRLAMAVGCGLRAVGWAGAMALLPRRRAVARSKAALQGWLFVRQLTHWRRPAVGGRAE